MIVTGGLDIRPRANMAVRLAKHLKAPADLREALENARQKLEDGLYQRRNLVVHGIHDGDSEHVMTLQLHRGKNTDPQPVSDEDLIQLGADLDKAVDELREVIVRHYRKPMEAMARNMRSAASDADSESGS